MLPVIDASGRRTSWQVTFFIIVLILVTLVPSFIGLSGYLYMVGAVASGLCFLFFGILFARARNFSSARRLFVISVFYLPILMTLLVADKVTR